MANPALLIENPPVPAVPNDNNKASNNGTLTSIKIMTNIAVITKYIAYKMRAVFASLETNFPKTGPGTSARIN